MSCWWVLLRPCVCCAQAGAQLSGPGGLRASARARQRAVCARRSCVAVPCALGLSSAPSARADSNQYCSYQIVKEILPFGARIFNTLPYSLLYPLQRKHDEERRQGDAARAELRHVQQQAASLQADLNRQNVGVSAGAQHKAQGP